LSIRREKVFGSGRTVPLDRNAKVRVKAYAQAWSARHRQPGQHKGPITRAFLEVLQALLWGFHNGATGACFPSYEAIAAKAGCARSTVAEAIKALEFAGILTWQNRIKRIRERCTDLFGRKDWRWRVLRTSNAYEFRDPKSENPGGTRNQGFNIDKGDKKEGCNEMKSNPARTFYEKPAVVGLDLIRKVSNAHRTATSG
jgi:hypothetical protein